ncbi:MAG: tetratricopeptide repeat protein [Acidobacteriota bacterium]
MLNALPSSTDSLRPLRLVFGLSLVLIGGLGFWLSWQNEAADDVWQQRRPSASYADLRQAVARAPANPRLWGALGLACLLDPQHLDYQESERHLRHALALAPNDVRLWGWLGDTLAISERVTEAEQTLRQAHALAPNHFITQWRLANALIRVGKLEEAAPYARGALRSNPTQAILMLDLGWRVSNGNQRFVESLLPPGLPDIEHQYLRLLVQQQHIVAAVQRWQAVLAQQPASEQKHTLPFIQDLLAARAYEAAWQVWSSLPGRQGEGLVRTAIYDGSFRKPVARTPIFEWRFQQHESDARLALDRAADVPTGGNALQITYDSPGPTFYHARQLLALPPGLYRLTYFVRSRELVAAAPPIVELRGVDNQNWRIRSVPPWRENQAWQRVWHEFTVPPDVGAVELIIMRPSECLTPGACPISGTVWFGGFALEMVSKAR